MNALFVAAVFLSVPQPVTLSLARLASAVRMNMAVVHHEDGSDVMRDKLPMSPVTVLPRRPER
jgi:methionyl-tRNA formyltransferase